MDDTQVFAVRAEMQRINLITMKNNFLREGNNLLKLNIITRSLVGLNSTPIPDHTTT